MADVQLNIMHPTDGRIEPVTVDETMTAQEAIQELIKNDFVQPNPHGYNLAIKGGAQLRSDQTFADAKVKEGDTLRVIPATDAGAKLGYRPLSEETLWQRPSNSV